MSPTIEYLNEQFDQVRALRTSESSGGRCVYHARSKNDMMPRAIKTIIKPADVPLNAFWTACEEGAKSLRHARDSADATTARHIIKVHEYGRWKNTAGDAFAVVMEWVEGPTLHDVLSNKREDGRLPILQAARLVAVLARALGTCHQEGVSHGDPKASNTLLRKRDHPEDGSLILGDESYIPVVCDFDMAWALSPDTSTRPAAPPAGDLPSNLAPERLAGHPPSPPGDIYALGVLLYECLTGLRPYDQVSESSIRFKHMRQMKVHDLASMDDKAKQLDDLNRICFHCLHKLPDERYSTAEQLAEDLDLFAANRPLRHAPKPTPQDLHEEELKLNDAGKKERRLGKRRWLKWVVTLSILLFVAVVVILVISHGLQRAKQQLYARYMFLSEQYRAAKADNSETAQANAAKLKDELDEMRPRLAGAREGSRNWHYYQAGEALRAVGDGDLKRAVQELETCDLDMIADARIRYHGFRAKAIIRASQTPPNYQDALVLFRKAHQSDPGYKGAWQMKAYEGICLTELRHLPEARDVLEGALKDYEHAVVQLGERRVNWAESDIRYTLVRCLLEMGDQASLNRAYLHTKCAVFAAAAVPESGHLAKMQYGEMIKTRAALGKALGHINNDEYIKMLRQAAVELEGGAQMYPMSKKAFAPALEETRQLLSKALP